MVCYNVARYWPILEGGTPATARGPRGRPHPHEQNCAFLELKNYFIIYRNLKLLFNFKNQPGRRPLTTVVDLWYLPRMKRARVTFQQVDLSVPANHHLLVWMDAQCFPDDTPAIVPGRAWWIGYRDAVPVCYCAVSTTYESRSPVAYLYRAGVMPVARGLGLQRKMIEIRCRYAKRQGRRKAVTVTAWNNAASMRSLMAAGFKPFRPTAYTQILETLVHWSRDL